MNSPKPRGSAHCQLIARVASPQEAFYGKNVIVADREMVESAADDILAGAKEIDVAFLVVGDPFG